MLKRWSLLCVDFVAAVLAWMLFFTFRKRVVEPSVEFSTIFTENRFIIGIVVVPICWIFIFWLLGLYQDISRRRVGEVLYSTAAVIFIGAIGLLLVALYDDDTIVYITYVRSFMMLLSIHLLLILLARVLFFTFGGVRRPVLVDLNQCNVGQSPNYEYDIYLPSLSKPDIIHALITQSKASPNVKLVVDEELALGSEYHVTLTRSAHPNMLNVLSDNMPYWQRNCKLVTDKIVSLLALIVLAPLMFYLAYRTSQSSSGPIFYRQKRVGIRHQVFDIIKYRSMYIDSEPMGPQLTQQEDDRVTAWGHFMRKYRLDELPQFYNVLMGDMSLVGPRPERPYYWQQLAVADASLHRLLTVRPGITSWGQVRYGYASNLQEILRRSKYDRLYIDNRSLWLDLRILFSTIGVVLKGKGH